jgi:hypothetical protein
MAGKGGQVPLFIDRLPFDYWEDQTRTPPLGYWTIVLPVLLSEANLPIPPANLVPQMWALDTANRGEGYAWRHHLLQAGLDPDQNRFTNPVAITAVVGGKTTVPIREADLWLVSNLGASAPPPFRIVLQRGLPFQDVAAIPDPQFHRPLIGVRALRRAGLRVEIDFASDTISVWTPDQTP